MIDNVLIHPTVLFFVGAVLISFIGRSLQKLIALCIPTIALVQILSIPKGTLESIQVFGFDLILFKLDSLSYPFAIIFSLIAIIGFIYSLHHSDRLEYSSALFYGGATLGVVLAGDLLTLYVFWEIMAIASTFLILARRTEQARRAAYRYFLVHMFGGLMLLLGMVIELGHGAGWEIRALELQGLGTWLVFCGIALNGAIPPLHAWLKDAYPEASVTGAIFLSAFTTKAAVYVMARIFSGEEILLYLGAIMTIVPTWYAILENDIRRVLSYSLINQVGFMMCGIGIGTALAINGVVAHAFCHVLYKALLFMSAGAVLHVTGRIHCTDLGSLYRAMPLTTSFCIIGAASTSGLPPLSGFVSKSIILEAAGSQGLTLIWLLLHFASAIVFHYIKVPYFMFFGRDSNIKAWEPPKNMLIAMGIAAIMCVFIGIAPNYLYGILPYSADYIPYSLAHVLAKLQMLLFGSLGFYLLLSSGYYPPEIRAINLDVDWFYRKGLGGFLVPAVTQLLVTINEKSYNVFIRRIPNFLKVLVEQGPYKLARLFIGTTRVISSEYYAQKLEMGIFKRLEGESASLGIGFSLFAVFVMWLIL